MHSQKSFEKCKTELKNYLKKNKNFKKIRKTDEFWTEISKNGAKKQYYLILALNRCTGNHRRIPLTERLSVSQVSGKRQPDERNAPPKQQERTGLN